MKISHATLLAASAAAAFVIAAPTFAATAQPEAGQVLSADQASPAMGLDAAGFAKQAKAGNLFEIESSKLAKDKAKDMSDVQMLADMLIADHTAAEQKLESLVPGAPMLPPKQQRMLDQLKSADGADFVALYIDMQAQAHMEAIALFRTYAGGGDDDALVSFATETLPKLEGHMDHVKQLIAAL